MFLNIVGGKFIFVCWIFNWLHYWFNVHNRSKVWGW